MSCVRDMGPGSDPQSLVAAEEEEAQRARQTKNPFYSGPYFAAKLPSLAYGNFWVGKEEREEGGELWPSSYCRFNLYSGLASAVSLKTLRLVLFSSSPQLLESYLVRGPYAVRM